MSDASRHKKGEPKPSRGSKPGERRGNAGKGRPAGAVNKTTRVLKDAIILAAETVGNEIEPETGVQGYCMDLARNHKNLFAPLLGKIIPLMVAGGLELQHKFTPEQLKKMAQLQGEE